MSSLTPGAGSRFTCRHLMQVAQASDCVFCHRDQLAQEVSDLRNDLTAAQLDRDHWRSTLDRIMRLGGLERAYVARDIALAAIKAAPSIPPRKAIAGDIGWVE